LTLLSTFFLTISLPIDILFSNIKHLLFQPCDNELIVVLHIHLKSPIMIGKKKAKDVQFFREVSDASFDETGNKKRKRNYHDEDELEAEQDERKRRADLNKYFKAFSDKIAEAVRLLPDLFLALLFPSVYVPPIRC
jgi:nucleosome binding factor SPN SPT16 subunit